MEQKIKETRVWEKTYTVKVTHNLIECPPTELIDSYTFAHSQVHNADIRADVRWLQTKL